MGLQGAIATATAVFLIARAVEADSPFRVAKRISLDPGTGSPAFVCLDRLAVLDRERLVYIGGPVEGDSVLTVLDIATLEVRNLTVPGIPGEPAAGDGGMAVDGPLFYDSTNGRAAAVLRPRGAVSGDAQYLEWDLGANRELRRLPLASVGDSPWLSVKAIGYDPDRGECYVEAVRLLAEPKTAMGEGGWYELTVLAVGESVRTVGRIETRNAFTADSPYFDPVHRRSAHVEYVETGGQETQTVVHIFDLAKGKVTDLRLPHLIYGFDFDTDGRIVYAYSSASGDVFKVEAATGATLNTARIGKLGHCLRFVEPRTLVLVRNTRLHFMESDGLTEIGGIDTNAFHAGPPNTDGSLVAGGRIFVRLHCALYVIDLLGFGL